MQVNPEVVRALEILDEARKADKKEDDLALVNRLRAARGEPPLTELDFEAFDKLMRDPAAGKLVL